MGADGKDVFLKACVSNHRLNFSGRVKLKFPLNSLLDSLENYFAFVIRMLIIYLLGMLSSDLSPQDGLTIHPQQPLELLREMSGDVQGVLEGVYGGLKSAGVDCPTVGHKTLAVLQETRINTAI